MVDQGKLNKLLALKKKKKVTFFFLNSQTAPLTRCHLLRLPLFILCLCGVDGQWRRPGQSGDKGEESMITLDVWADRGREVRKAQGDQGAQITGDKAQANSRWEGGRAVGTSVDPAQLHCLPLTLARTGLLGIPPGDPRVAEN